MLNLLRKNTKIIIWIIVASFVLWGAFSVGVSFDKDGRFAGQAFGKDITFQEFNRFLRSARIFSFTEKPSDDPELVRLMAWQSLIFAREAQRQKIEVTDDEVRKELKRLLSSFGIGDADAATYRKWLETTVRMEPREFETMLRETMRIQKLLKHVGQMPVEQPSEDDVRNFYQLENTILSAETVALENSEEAAELSRSVKSEADWEKITGEKKYEKMPFENMPLLAPVRALSLAPEDVAILKEIPAGQVSPAISAEKKHAVFFIKAKQSADMTAFDQKKDELIKAALERKKQAYLTAWNMDVMKRANLKDFSQPPAEELAAPAEEKAPEPAAP